MQIVETSKNYVQLLFSSEWISANCRTSEFIQYLFLSSYMSNFKVLSKKIGILYIFQVTFLDKKKCSKAIEELSSCDFNFFLVFLSFLLCGMFT